MSNLDYIYLDHSATTPVDPLVVEAMLPYFSEHYGNAASKNHPFGWVAAEGVDVAREKIAGLIGCDSEEIILTSGATESDNLALKGIMELHGSKGHHLITCTTEHKAVLDSCKHLERQGFKVSYLTVNRQNEFDLKILEAAIRPETVMISLMYANNETGTINPVAGIAEIAKKHGVLFFCDATQAMGRLDVNVEKDGIDCMALTAHKIYGPKGCGALYVRRRNPRVRLLAQMDGGGHERGFRSGTLNVPGIVGFGKAAELASERLKGDAAHMSALRDTLENAFVGAGLATANGSITNRLPHISNLCFAGVQSSKIIGQIKNRIAVSTGSACSSANPAPSHVLSAMGMSRQEAESSIRFSLGRSTTAAQIQTTIELVEAALKS